MNECRELRPTGLCTGKQGFTYNEGISRETVGAQIFCMHFLTIPPGGRVRAHKHLTHETAPHARGYHHHALGPVP